LDWPTLAVQEVFDLLSDTLNKRHSVRLEWIVICLIILECCITVATFLYSEYQHSQQKSIQAAWGSYARKRGLVMMDALAFLKRLVLPQNFSHGVCQVVVPVVDKKRELTTGTSSLWP
jgi:hypothetical protein